MSTHSSQDFDLADLESDLKNLSDDLYLDDVGEWRQDAESYSSESDNEYLTRGQNSRTPQRQNRGFRQKGRGVGSRRGVNRFPYRGKYRPSGRRNFSGSSYRQFNNERGMNLREDEWRRKSSSRRSDSFSKEDDPDSSIRRNKDYEMKRREEGFAANRNSGNESESLQSTVAEDTHKNTLFDRINTFSGSKCNEIPGLEFAEAYNDEKDKKQYGQEKQRERNKRQEHSPEHLRSSYSDKMSLSPPHSSKRRSLERTGSSSSYYNSENRTSRRHRSEYDSRRHRSRSVSPRSPRSDRYSRDRSPQNQPYGNSRRNVSSQERYFHRTDVSPRRSISVSPERNRNTPVSVTSASENPMSKKEWYPEVEPAYLTQPPSSAVEYQNSQQMPNVPPAYSRLGQYADTAGVTVPYGTDYRNYNHPDYRNPSYPGYDVNNATYFHQPPPNAAPVQPYMPSGNPQEYTRTDVCQQDVRWPVHTDTSMPYGGQNQPRPQVPACPQGMFENTNSSNCPSVDPEKNIEEKKKKEAIENELKQQRRSLAKQREEYYNKSRTMRKELELLQDQKKELLAEKLPGNEKILKENQKLQAEIQNKLKAIANVTEMLSTIIGDDKDLIEELEEERKNTKAEEGSKLQKMLSEKNSPTHDRGVRIPSPPMINTREQSNRLYLLESYKHNERSVQESERLSSTPGEANTESHYNYVHYDPEMHWCRVCNVFPKTAKEYLNHLHTAEHKEKTLEKNVVDMPWHKNQPSEEILQYEGAPVKRLPIRGLQFFISATAWYCKLCDVWIGDLHCASVHLKSTLHSQKYSAFTEQNPHWEVDWLADRTHAYEKTSDSHQKLSENSDALNRSSSFRIYSDRDMNENAVEITTSLSDQLMSVLKEKNKKRSRLRRKRSKSSDSSSSDSSSSSSTSSDDGSDQEEEKTIDRAHSIRVAMRNKDIPSTKASKSSCDLYDRKKYSSPDKETFRESRRSSDDRILHEWMEFSDIDKDRDMINNLKDRLKRKQATDHEVVERKKQYEKRRSSKEEHRRYDERYMRDDHRRYDDRRKGYDDARKRNTSKYGIDERHGSRRNEKSPDRRSEKSKYDKSYSKTEGTRIDHKHPDSDDKHFTKSETSCNSAKQNTKSVQDENDSDANESSLEKLTAESAAKKKDVKKNVQPFKCKLPFIGRMPFIGKIPAIKKKSEGDNGNKESKQDSKSDASKQGMEIPKLNESSTAQKDNSTTASTTDSGTSHNKDEKEPSEKTVKSPLNTSSTTSLNSTDKNVFTTVSAPTVTSTNVTAISTASDNSNITAVVSSNKGTSSCSSTKEQVLPKSTLILSKTPGIVAKSAPLLKKKKLLDDGIAGGVEDMDIEVEDNEELAEENLPKDFQDALDILFPTETPPVDNYSVENQSLTSMNSSVPNNPKIINTMSVGPNQSNMMHNAEIISNQVNSDPGQRNMIPMGHIPGLVHQYGINNVPPMGAPGHVDANHLNSGGHMKPSILGPGPLEHSQMGLKPNLPCDRQVGSELEAVSGRQLSCRPDFNMMPNRMGQCLMGPGPDHGFNHLSHQQGRGPEMMMPQAGPGLPVCPGMMGPGPPAGPGPVMPPGLAPEPRPVRVGPEGMPPAFSENPGGTETDHSRGGFIFKRKNPPSQKKRQQMKKRRDMLEAREKELNEKIAELKGKMAGEQNVKDEEQDSGKKEEDSKKLELALLGIDEDDICCN